MRIIKYSPGETDKKLRNMEQLKAGIGCKFLLCFVSDDERGETFIAKNWKRRLPLEVSPWELIIDFS